MNSSNPLLSVIIVNFNGGGHLKKAVDSLQNLTTPFETIIVDNNSSDNSLEFTKDRKDIVTIKNSCNLGFSKANNIGVQNSKGLNILLLNNDAAILDDINSLIDKLNSNPLSIWSCKMIGESGKVRPSFGRFPSSILDIALPSRLYNTPTSAVGSIKPDWVEGSFMLTTKKLWDIVGGFDEKIFMYGEDIQLCREVRDLGGEINVDQTISYFHKGGFNDSKKGNIYIGFLHYSRKKPEKFERIKLVSAIKIMIVLKYIYSRIMLNGEAAASYKRAMFS
ncbi:glycosyltransferase family 2 protein [Halopseudomonas pachastrellae]|uniref:glycosyltransferase family 2 protein n=1 Tax=Halopseudomonas pachastrellae TaxID=254161 RepID=UPI003D7DBB31